MSYLVMAKSKDALAVAKHPTLEKWPNIPTDPIEIVELTKLLAFLTGDTYKTIFDSYTKLTPKQPDVEPWDFENLVNPVFLVPEPHVRALASMEDDKMLGLAKKWCAIEEMKFYKFDAADLKQTLAEYREFAAKCLRKKLSLLILVAS
jgi:hypothetical protein